MIGEHGAQLIKDDYCHSKRKRGSGACWFSFLISSFCFNNFHYKKFFAFDFEHLKKFFRYKPMIIWKSNRKYLILKTVSCHFAIVNRLNKLNYIRNHDFSAPQMQLEFRLMFMFLENLSQFGKKLKGLTSVSCENESNFQSIDTKSEIDVFNKFVSKTIQTCLCPYW